MGHILRVIARGLRVCLTAGVLIWGGRQTVLTADAQEPPGQPPTLTRAEQVRKLKSAEARQGAPVRLSGVVTFSDPQSGLLFVADGSGSVFVAPLAERWNWPVGRAVEVEGVVAPGNHLPYVARAVLRDLGPGTLPPARPVSFSRLVTDEEDGNWVEIRGVVRVAGLKRNQPTFEVAAEGRRLRAILSDAVGVPERLEALVDAEVRLRGIPGIADGTPNAAPFLDFHVPGLTNLVVEVPAAAQDLTLPPRPIASLSWTGSAATPVHRVRIQGQLSAAPGGGGRVADGTGSLRIPSPPGLLISTNSRVDLLGFPGGTRADPALEDTVFYLPAWPQGTPAQGGPEPARLLPVLGRAETVRDLPRAEAQRGYPVQIQGVVTYWDPDGRLLFVQDESSGIAVEDAERRFAGKAGQAVTVAGYSGQGSYAPILRQPRFELQGSDRLTPAKPVTVEDLQTWREDSQRVELRGIVRFVRIEGRRLEVTINAGASLVTALIPGFDGPGLPEHLVDAEVRCRGVCDTVVNKERQRLGFRLLTASLADILVTRPAPADPFALVPQPVGELFRFRSPSDMRHRIRVQGAVTFRDSRWCTLLLQDGQDGLYVRTLAPPAVDLGDRIDAVGFIAQEPFGPVMTEALVRKLGPGTPPPPVAITIDQALSGEYQSRLVTLEARLVDRLSDTQGRGLRLQQAEWGFTALLESSQDPGPLNRIRPNSRVRLTGVCRLEGGDARAAKALRLQLRAPADVQLLSAPARLAAGHWRLVAGLAAAFFVAATGWVLLLRRTLRRQTEIIRRELERQHALEAQYGALFNHVNDLIQSVRLDGSLAHVNPAWLHALGYTAAEAARLHLRQVVPPEDLPRYEEWLRRAAAGETLDHVAARFRRKNGEIIEVEGNLTPGSTDGAPAVVRSIFRDVTERNRADAAARSAHEQLVDSEKKYRALVQRANTIILRWNAEGQITFLNEFGLRFFGYSAEEIFGRQLVGTIVPPVESGGRDLRHLIAQISLKPDAYELNINENIRSNGERVWVAWTNHMEQDAQGQVVEIFSVGTDITERKRAEEAVRELNASLEQRVAERTAELAVARDRAQEADRLKSAFLATMSHELRTPLNSIIGFTGILLQQLAGPLNPEQNKQLGMVRDSARHLLALINDVLDISKIEAGQLEVAREPMDLRASIEKVAGVVKPLADRKGLALKVELPPRLPRLISDQRRVEQVLLNLLNNALKFTESGEVRLAVDWPEEPAPAAAEGVAAEAASPRPSALRLRVRDSGMGIKPEHLRTLFQPFRQLDTGLSRQHEGTGLGLAICRRLVDLLGGEIHVESEWGHGSTFWFTLPLAALPSELLARTEAAASAPPLSPAP